MQMARKKVLRDSQKAYFGLNTLRSNVLVHIKRVWKMLQSREIWQLKH